MGMERIIFDKQTIAISVVFYAMHIYRIPGNSFALYKYLVCDSFIHLESKLTYFAGNYVPGIPKN